MEVSAASAVAAAATAVCCAAAVRCCTRETYERPRPATRSRRPAWAPGRRESPPLGWRLASGEASNTVATDGLDDTLTGEAAGRQVWWYDATAAKEERSRWTDSFDPSMNPNSADRIFREAQLARCPDEAPETNPPASATEAARKGARFYSMLQCEDGHWAGDYGGPMFLLPGLVIAGHVTGSLDELLPKPGQEAAVLYLRNHQQVDGGWGTHIESASTMFGTTLSYVMLRLLGVAAADPAAVAARTFMQTHGGALCAPSWAKFWLAVLGVYDWAGVNSMPVEMWLLPDWLPFHPGRLWCHCRMVYLPMGYLLGTIYMRHLYVDFVCKYLCAFYIYSVRSRYIYSRRFAYPSAATDSTTASLREELYLPGTRYESVDWDSARHTVADIDNYTPVGGIMRTAHNMLAYYERLPSWLSCFGLRERGLAFAEDYIQAEDLQTNYICIGPVNKAMHLLCAWLSAGGDASTNAAVVARRHPSFRRHLARVSDYLWVAEDGLKMQGYNGSQCWDTSFAIQAMIEAGAAEELPRMTEAVWRYLEATQILSTEVSRASPACRFEEPSMRRKYYRHVSKGGWPFSTSAHGWPISDCTAEGLKSVLELRSLACIQAASEGGLPQITDERLQDAVNVLLTLQNPESGGWATYENTRGWAWYELLNPSETFGDIMIDIPYVECTCASLSALKAFHERFPKHRPAEISHAIAAGRNFIESVQRPDGSWYGSWGCCFTYGSWFGLEGLTTAGLPSDSPAVVRGVPTPPNKSLLRATHNIRLRIISQNVSQN